MNDLLVIDGSEGEGGGQVLRTALSLSVATGRPFSIENIRARRRRPGLMRQHLTAVRAAAEICGARVEGAEPGASALTFRPGPVRAGEYHFAVGTAGSACLVFQTVLVPLLGAEGPSRIVVEGGTHNPLAPPFEFLDRAFLPLLRRIGADVTLELERPGFYPAGGGRFVAEIRGPAQPSALELFERGEPLGRDACAVVVHLSRKIAEREIAVVRRRLGWGPEEGRVVVLDEGPGPGNVVWIELRHAQVTEVFTAFGQHGVRAERVGQLVSREARRYLAHDAPVGPHLCDQLLLPLALGRGGAFRTTAVTPHARTNAEVIGRFLEDVTVEMRGLEAGGAMVEVRTGAPQQSGGSPMGAGGLS